MRYYDDVKKKFKELSVADIEKIRGGVYSDHIVLSLLDELTEKPSEDTLQRRLALTKLVCRSPQVDPLFAYDQIILDLLYDSVDSGQGEALLYYALFAWMYFIKQGIGLDLMDFLNIARGFLYQGRVDVFVAFLRRLLKDSHLLDYHLTTLIEDFARLNELDLARHLDAVGKQAISDDWSEINLADYVTVEFPHAFLEGGVRQDIRDLITPENLTQEENEDHPPALLDRSELIEALSSKPSDQDLLLWVPDMLNIVLGDQYLIDETDDVIIKALGSIQSSMLPEFSLLGDILKADQEPVFTFTHLGKACGYHFSSLVDMATDAALSPDVRLDVAEALMKTLELAPEHRMEVLEILTKLMNTPETVDGAAELIVTGIVADLLDTDLYEMKPAVVKAFEEDKVSPEMVRPNSFTGKWHLPELEEKLAGGVRTVLLECRQCGLTREYAVDYVLVMHMEMTDWSSDSIIFDHPITCKKCGARESYKLSPFSVIQLFPVIFMPEDADDLTRGIDQTVYIIPNPENLFFDGYSPVIFDEVRRKVVAQGVNDLDALAQGEYYRVIGKFKESLSAFRKAHCEDPKNRLAALALAMAEHDYGDRDRAKALYDQALYTGGIALSQDRVNDVAAQGLSALEEGQGSPYNYPRNRDKRTLLQNQMGGNKRKRR